TLSQLMLRLLNLPQIGFVLQIRALSSARAAICPLVIPHPFDLAQSRLDAESRIIKESGFLPSQE
ncbi:MAG: hypothetical protein ACYSUD_15900, partial [Planctomycetota bacterium]